MPRLEACIAAAVVAAVTLEGGSPALAESPPASRAHHPADPTPSARDATATATTAAPEPDPTAGPEAEPLLSRESLTGSWRGARSQLEARGISFEASLVAEYSQNLRGGLDTQGDAFRHLFDANLTFDSEPLLGYEGGTLFVDFQTFEGQNGSDEVGDFQAFSNLDADGFTALYELWYQQWLADGVIRIKAGKLDANSEFAYVEHGLEFLQSSMGFSPTILSFPSYPDPATSVNVFLYPTDRIYLGFGLYDGALREGIATGRRGPRTFFDSPADLFYIVELGLTWALPDGLEGRLGLGGWGHDGTFERWAGGVEDGTSGFYLVFDQWLWREAADDADDAQGVGVFVQYGYADEAVAEAEHHIGGGFQWTGALPTRDDDVLGFGVSTVLFSQEAREAGEFAVASETAVELFYRAQLTPYLALKPDVQYIFNPGNPGGPETDDALVVTLRVEAWF